MASLAKARKASKGIAACGNDRLACLARGGKVGEMNAACGKNEPAAATMPEREFWLRDRSGNPSRKIAADSPT